jgi:hypothetical protein
MVATVATPTQGVETASRVPRAASDSYSVEVTMAVQVKVLIPAKIAEATQTTQYTATNVSTIIDKFTATNYDTSARTISINLVTSLDTAGNNNLVIKSKTLLPSETYTFPELVGHILAPGGYISTLASTGTAINIRASGREVS